MEPARAEAEDLGRSRVGAPLAVQNRSFEQELTRHPGRLPRPQVKEQSGLGLLILCRHRGKPGAGGRQSGRRLLVVDLNLKPHKCMKPIPKIKLYFQEVFYRLCVAGHICNPIAPGS